MRWVKLPCGRCRRPTHPDELVRVGPGSRICLKCIEALRRVIDARVASE